MTAPAFDKVIDLLKRSADPYKDILGSSAYWYPLQFLYPEMVRNGDIVRLSDLPRERKLKYWAMVDPGWDKWKKKTVCQALYVWDEIKNE